MHILYVISDLEVGGAERHLVQVLPGLKAAGHQVQVYTLTHKGKLAPDLEQSGVEVIAPPLSTTLRKLPRPLGLPILLALSALKLWLILFLRRPRIAHFFLSKAYLLGGVLSLLSPGIIKVMSRRSLNNYQARYPLFAKIERWLHPRMNAVLGNSKAVTAQLVDEGVRENQLGLIYNGLDLDKFRTTTAPEDVRNHLGLSTGDIVVSLVANLIPYKGHADLVEGMATVKDHLPDMWRILCVGRDDGIGADLAARANELGLGDNFHWLGARHDVADILSASDIGLLCSHEEGFSNAVLEGMASGLPMVVTDVGGNPEAVVHGETGLVVPSRSPEQLGQAIADLMNDAEKCRAMGEAGDKRLRENFTIEKTVARYDALYQGLASGQDKSVQSMIDGK